MNQRYLLKYFISGFVLGVIAWRLSTWIFMPASHVVFALMFGLGTGGVLGFRLRTKTPSIRATLMGLAATIGFAVAFAVFPLPSIELLRKPAELLDSYKFSAGYVWVVGIPFFLALLIAFYLIRGINFLLSHKSQANKDESRANKDEGIFLRQ